MYAGIRCHGLGTIRSGENVNVDFAFDALEAMGDQWMDAYITMEKALVRMSWNELSIIWVGGRLETGYHVQNPCWKWSNEDGHCTRLGQL